MKTNPLCFESMDLMRARARDRRERHLTVWLLLLLAVLLAACGWQLYVGGWL